MRFNGMYVDYIETTRSAKLKEEAGPAFTAILDEEVMGYAGVTLAYPGVGLAWSILSARLLKWYPIWTTRTVRRLLADVIVAFNLHRVELVVVADNHTALRWANTLKFEKENGLARRFTTNGKDAIRFERVIA